MFFFNWLYRLFYGKDAADDMDRAPPPRKPPAPRKRHRKPRT
jgi:hypothetical protein